MVHWPAGMSSAAARQSDSTKYGENDGHGRICHSPWVMMDIVATCCDLAGVPTTPGCLEGESFLPILYGNNDTSRKEPIFWEHQGNWAVREGPWKLVYKRCYSESTSAKQDRKEDDAQGLELYNIKEDRTELCNLALQHQDRVEHMLLMWKEWAARAGVKPWPLHSIPDGEEDWSNRPWMW